MQWNRLSLGVATVAVGALIGGLLYVRSQPHTYVAVAQAIPIGHRITAADLRVVRISTDAGITPIPASQISAVVGKTAQVDLEPGSLLVPADLTDKAVPAPGQQLVPLGIDIDRMPNQLGAGDSVVLVVTPDGTIVSGDDTTATVETYPATVYDIGKPNTSQQTIVVDVVVADHDGPAIAAAAAAGRITINLAPR